jgi:hypothetical protein
MSDAILIADALLGSVALGVWSVALVLALRQRPARIVADERYERTLRETQEAWARHWTRQEEAEAKARVKKS